ncbi:hypothetical protein [Thermocatellispora tengchongensis]|uniref:hypothetical protein n=1 Tax=Thermocatellispora tengchongensis TaxID=1073253 RepID=UPI003631E273
MTAVPPASDLPAVPAALAEPVARVRARWVALISLANLALWMGYFGPLQVLLPEQVAGIDPEGKEIALAWVTGLGAAVAMVATPLAGALSDRTTGRFGRRHPGPWAGPREGRSRSGSWPSRTPWPG